MARFTYNHHQPTVGFQPLNVLTYTALGWMTAVAGGDRMNIRYLADWPGVVATLPAAYLTRAWVPCPVQTPDVQILCLARK